MKKTNEIVLAAEAEIISPENNKPQRVIEGWLAGQLSEHTRASYRSDLKSFLKFIGKDIVFTNGQDFINALASVDSIKAAEFRDKMFEQGYAPGTIARKLSVISNIYKVLKSEGLIKSNPFRYLKRPKVSNQGLTAAFSKEEAEALLNIPDRKTKNGERDYIILLLLFYTGLRRSELVQIKGEDFMYSGNHLLIRVKSKGKSGKTDLVKIPDIVKSDIENYISNKKDCFLFTANSRNKKYNIKSKPLSTVRIYHIVKKYCKKAGINADKYSPHSMRTSFITFSLEGGAPLRDVMYAARHSNPATTIRYDRARMNWSNHPSQYLNLNND